VWIYIQYRKYIFSFKGPTSILETVKWWANWRCQHLQISKYNINLNHFNDFSVKLINAAWWRNTPWKGKNRKLLKFNKVIALPTLGCVSEIWMLIKQQQQQQQQQRCTKELKLRVLRAVTDYSRVTHIRNQWEENWTSIVNYVFDYEIGSII
jgi:hypothetical protein